MADVMIDGFMRDSSTGLLLVCSVASAVAPVRMVDGFLRDARGYLVVQVVP